MTTIETKEIDWTLLPEHLHGGARAYIEQGRPTGDFLAAVIVGDHKGAYARADEVNRLRLADIFAFFEKHAPAECHGSFKKRLAWIERRGLEGGDR